MNHIVGLIGKVDDCINTLISDYESQINLLCTIPGVRRDTAVTIISEIGVDMSQFGSSKRLCCWAGLPPPETMSPLERKSLSAFHVLEYISNRHWWKSPMLP